MLATVLFAGCEKKQIKPISEFESDFTLFYNDMKMKGELICKDDNSVEINILSPETLKGLKITAKDNNFKADYNGIKVSYTKDDLPQGAFFKLIVTSLENILKTDELRFEAIDNEYVSFKNSALGEIKITLNKDMFIEKIEIPNQSFNIKLHQKSTS